MKDNDTYIVRYRHVIIINLLVFTEWRFRISDYTESNCRMSSEWWIGEDVEGSGRGLIWGFNSLNLTEEGLKKTMKTLG
jgi:hypothetical protein